MSILPASLLVDRTQLEIVVSQLNHLANVAALANQQAAELLNMSDEDLTAWLQRRAQAGELSTLLQRHADFGAAVNAAIAIAQDTLEECGIYRLPMLVDTSPFDAKIQVMGRVIDMQTMTVTTPEPEPEPENNDENETEI